MATSSDAGSSWNVDPAFRFTPSGPLHPPADVHRLDAWRHLTSLVCRDPLDLAAHVRRVLLCAADQNSGLSFPALVDLFLALGPAGKGLRAALVEAAADSLAPEERNYLRAHLDRGLSTNDVLPVGVSSSLDRGVMGTAPMVLRERTQVADETAVQRASALLDQGDVAAARRLLEDSLMQSPDDDVATELLLIYRHSRDEGAIAAMKQQLMSKFGRLPASWA